MGSKLSQDTGGAIIPDAKENLSATTGIKIPPISQKMGERDATSAEIALYQSIVGR